MNAQHIEQASTSSQVVKTSRHEEILQLDVYSALLQLTYKRAIMEKIVDQYLVLLPTEPAFRYDMSYCSTDQRSK